VIATSFSAVFDMILRCQVTKALLTEFKDKTVDAGTEAIGGSVSGIADNVLKSLRH